MFEVFPGALGGCDRVGTLERSPAMPSGVTIVSLPLVIVAVAARL